MRKLLLFYGIFSLLLSAAVAAQAITIDMVTVGNPGNAPDTVVMNDGTTGYGEVDYTYKSASLRLPPGSILRSSMLWPGRLIHIYWDESPAQAALHR